MRNYSRCSKLCCLVIATVLSWLFAVSANAQVSMSLKDVSVRSAVEYLQKEYHYSFTIGTDDIDINKHVTVQVKNVSIQNALDRIFAGQNVSYKVNGKNISVVAKKLSPRRQQSLWERPSRCCAPELSWMRTIPRWQELS